MPVMYHCLDSQASYFSFFAFSGVLKLLHSACCVFFLSKIRHSALNVFGSSRGEKPVLIML